LIYTYFELATDVSSERLSEIKNKLADNSVNPRDLKRNLAKTIVAMYYSESESIKAEEEFDKVFINKGVPDNIPEIKFETSEMPIIELITTLNFAPSKAEARRLIQQGGVSINNKKITDFKVVIKFDTEQILKVGKRKFAKILQA